MWAALHACGFGLPRLLKHSGIRPINSHLHCSRLLSYLFSMPESDSAKEKSSASMSPMGILSRLAFVPLDYQKRLLPLDSWME